MKKSRVLDLKYALLMIPLLSVFLLTFSVNVKADSSSLPYFVDNDSFDFHGFSVSDIQTYINNKFINDGAPQYSVDLENNVTIMYIGYENNAEYLAIYTKSNSQDTNYYFSNYSSSIENFDISSDHVTLNFTKCYRILLKLNSNGTLGWKTWYVNQTQSFNLFGSYYTPIYINNIFYNQSYIGGVINSSDIAVLTNVSFLHNSGHATVPINDPDNFVNDLNGHRITKPTFPTINNYSWTTYNNPPIDTSTAESLLESIWDSLVYNFSYLFSNLGGLFATLTDNLENFTNYISDSLYYVSNNIVSAIQNFATDFYNNMVSLFEPMFEPIFKIGLFFSNLVALGTDPSTDMFSIPYFTQVMLVPDAVNVVELIVANDEFDLIESGKTIVTSFPLIINQLTSVSPSPTFHIPSCYFHGRQIGDFDISFSWFNNYKLYYDIVINGFLIIGYIYWLFVSFSHHMRGAFLPEQSDDAYQRHNIGF